MIVHELGGCAPTPLAHYLKALGVLRLVAEQADSDARGWWERERYFIATVMDEEELRYFLLNQYRPSPIFNPWGARSGFYPGSSEKSARSVLESIASSNDHRFTHYRYAIGQIREVISNTTGGSKPEGDAAQEMLFALRHRVRGSAIRWLDSVAASITQGEDVAVTFPALFGTGGSEGSGSYTSAYMAALDQCLLKRKWDHALEPALFHKTPLSDCCWSQSLGQFVPSGVTSPWDLLLAFEGASSLRSAVSSRYMAGANRWMASPFIVAPTANGYSSGAGIDENVMNKGKILPGRGEQWFPLWENPIRFDELMQLFIEGRATARTGRATDGWSMARAVSSLGVRSGIQEFVRYGYQQRNNMATHFAVPLGRFRVSAPASNALCLDDLDLWASRSLRRQAREKNAPSRLRIAERKLADALFNVLQRPNEPPLWQSVLLNLADVEAVMRGGSGFKAGPIPALRPEWVSVAADPTPEFRLAVCNALQASGFSRSGGAPIDGVRRHWLPLDPKKLGSFAVSGDAGHQRLMVGPAVVMFGRSGEADLIALLERRLIESAQIGQRRVPLEAAHGANAAPADLAALTQGSVDLDRTMQLSRALMALDGAAWARQPRPPPQPAANTWPDDAWLAIRLAMLPWPLADRVIPADPAVLRRLAAGDAATAVELALRRLRSAGVAATVRVAAVPPDTARRWAAALAFPISRKTAIRFLMRLDPNSAAGDPHAR